MILSLFFFFIKISSIGIYVQPPSSLHYTFYIITPCISSDYYFNHVLAINASFLNNGNLTWYPDEVFKIKGTQQ